MFSTFTCSSFPIKVNVTELEEAGLMLSRVSAVIPMLTCESFICSQVAPFMPSGALCGVGLGESRV